MDKKQWTKDFFRWSLENDRNRQEGIDWLCAMIASMNHITSNVSETELDKIVAGISNARNRYRDLN